MAADIKKIKGCWAQSRNYRKTDTDHQNNKLANLL